MKRQPSESTRYRTRRLDSANPHSRSLLGSAPQLRIAKREIAERPYPPPSEPGRCACGNRLSVEDTGGVCLECREVGA